MCPTLRLPMQSAREERLCLREKGAPPMIRDAWEIARNKLRMDPYYPLPVPTLLEVAACYRRLVPGARIRDIREMLQSEKLPLADAD